MYKWKNVKWDITKFTVGPLVSRSAFTDVAHFNRDSGTSATVFAGGGVANICRELLIKNKIDLS